MSESFAPEAESDDNYRFRNRPTYAEQDREEQPPVQRSIWTRQYANGNDPGYELETGLDPVHAPKKHHLVVCFRRHDYSG
jgi:hypothetical protein